MTAISSGKRDRRAVAAVRAWRPSASFVVLAIPPLLLVAAGWRKRWSADDAFIFYRVVDNVLHGFGPVFNHGERVEAYTSPLWVFILSLIHGIAGFVALEWTAVGLGLLLSAAGLFAASLGAMTLARAAGRSGIGVPLGALVLVSLRPMWDFATSGLETGLGFAWLGFTFLCVARVAARGVRVPGECRRTDFALAFLIGLGPLVRPDFAIFSVGFLIAQVVALRPIGKRRIVALVAAAGALPIAYQVFRMGYFATLVPNTAIAKEAGLADWSRGWTYLKDFVRPYALWVPVGLLAALFVVQMRAAATPRRLLVAMLAPVACGLLHGLYVVRVGGDFMHARMLLPSLFAILLPAMAMPLPRARPALAIGAMVGVWVVVCAAALKAEYPAPPPFGPSIEDERAFYVGFAGNPHPVTLEDYSNASWVKDAKLLRARVGREDVVVLRPITQRFVPEPAYPYPPSSPALPSRVVGAFYAVGLVSYAVGPDVWIVDRLGLGDPIGARVELQPLKVFGGAVRPARHRAGHEKNLPEEWVAARFADRGSSAGARLVRVPAVSAASRAMSCGDLRDLLHAVTVPLTPGKFISNIGTAWRVRSLRFPSDPAAAAAQLCGS